MGRYLDEFTPGQVLVSPSRTITETDLVQFAAISGDWNPVHTDETFARDGEFSARVAHGPMMIGITFGLLSRVNFIDGTVIALRRLDWDFQGPVYIGDTVHATGEILDIVPHPKRKDRGRLRLQLNVLNQDDNIVQRGHCELVMRRQVPTT